MRRTSKKSIKPNTRMVWIETPSNPLLKIIDIEAIAKIAREKKIISVSDNTFATPWIQRPIEAGFDMVIHSATKYLNGHSDMVGGVIVVGENKELADQIAFLQNSVGAIAGPFDSFLAMRGLKDAGPCGWNGIARTLWRSRAGSRNNRR